MLHPHFRDIIIRLSTQFFFSFKWHKLVSTYHLSHWECFPTVGANIEMKWAQPSQMWERKSQIRHRVSLKGAKRMENGNNEGHRANSTWKWVKVNLCTLHDCVSPSASQRPGLDCCKIVIVSHNSTAAVKQENYDYVPILPLTTIFCIKRITPLSTPLQSSCLIFYKLTCL